MNDSSASCGEERLHHIFRSSWRRRKGLSGPGDDCARLRPPEGEVLVSCDQVAAGVHAPEGTPLSALARKLLRRSASDLAAAGARPWACCWTLAAPTRTSGGELAAAARAFLDEAHAFGFAVFGGDLTTAPCTVLTATVCGRPGPRPAPGRGGARPGDVLVVTGRLGGAVRSGRHLLPEPRLAAGARLVALGAHALMDLSDGLARDLPRLLEAGGVGAVVDLDALPLAPDLAGLSRDRALAAAVGEGEDYELLAALSPRAASRALDDPVLAATGLTRIGRVVAAPGLGWRLDGRAVPAPAAGWEHRWNPPSS